MGVPQKLNWWQGAQNWLSEISGQVGVGVVHVVVGAEEDIVPVGGRETALAERAGHVGIDRSVPGSR